MTSVLTMPNFSKIFMIKNDACGVGIRVVLMQEGRPLAFTSRAFFDKNLSKSTYEKEMLIIIHAIQHWRLYLNGHHFIIFTDHHSLKLIIDQHIYMPKQQKWVTKLLGYDYEIVYRKPKRMWLPMLCLENLKIRYHYKLFHLLFLNGWIRLNMSGQRIAPSKNC